MACERTEILCITGLGSNGNDPFIIAAHEVAEASAGSIRVHVPQLNEVTDTSVAVPPISEQGRKVSEFVSELDPPPSYVLTHSLGLLVATYAGIDFRTTQITGITPAFTSAAERIEADSVGIANDLTTEEWDIVKAYGSRHGGVAALIRNRRQGGRPLLVTKGFMDESKGVSPLDRQIPMLQTAQTKNRNSPPRLILLAEDTRLGNQTDGIAAVRQAIPSLRIEICNEISDHFLRRPRKAAVALVRSAMDRCFIVPAATKVPA
ncbi:MAG TPA: hypothetical protein VGG13_02500 [Candidatus Saccharimonadales bacterium]|jgi:hypothetical protein